MTTPDEEITGYGGQPKTGPNSASSTSTSTSSQSTTGSTMGHAAEDAKAKARHAADEVKTQGKSQLEGYRETAADELEAVAQAQRPLLRNWKGRIVWACPLMFPPWRKAWSNSRMTYAARALISFFRT